MEALYELEQLWLGSLLLYADSDCMQLRQVIADLRSWEHEMLSARTRALVADVLAGYGQEEIGYLHKEYCFELFDKAPADWQWPFRRWRNLAAQRHAVSKLKQFITLTDDANPHYSLEDISQVLEVLKRDVYRLQQPNTIDGVAAMSLVAEAETRIDTGFPLIDKLIKGIGKTWLVVVGARTSIGKSALIINIAVMTPLKVCLVSTEMTPKEIAGRVKRWGKTLRSNVELLVTPQTDIDKVLGLIPAKTELVLLDYLQHLRSSKSQTRWEELSYICQALKHWSMEREVPIIAAAQLNRRAHGQAPEIADLRESGAIEQDADVVILLQRDNEAISWKVAKHRHEKADQVFVDWDDDIGQWREREQRSWEAGYD